MTLNLSPTVDNGLEGGLEGRSVDAEHSHSHSGDRSSIEVDTRKGVPTTEPGVVGSKH
jgi:hypothetical protein